MKNFAVFISGYGRGAMEIIKDYKRSLIKPNLKLILSSNDEAPCLAFADLNGIPYEIVDQNRFRTKQTFEKQILEALHAHDIHYVYLAGWRHILGPTLLNAYPDKIVNVHASLLPSFKGLNGIQQAMDYGVKITGVTTHFVDKTIDGGKIIAQKCIEIKEDDTFDDIDNRLFKITTLINLETINQVFK
jgi:phosphoribosylglycinamide formyltransferase-1